METFQDFLAFGKRRIVRQRRGGGDGCQILERHVGEQQRKLVGRGRGQRETSALDRGEIFAHRINFGDGRAAGDQCFVEGDGVVERDLAVAGAVPASLSRRR